MKKYITIALLVLASCNLVSAQVSVGQTSAPYAEEIGDVPDSVVTCTVLTYGLKLRSKDSNTNNEVTLLQEFLQDSDLLDSDPTGYFGAATQKAVRVFQKQSGLLASGFVGAYTRKAIKDKSCNQTNTTPEAKKIIETNVPVSRKDTKIYACTMEHRACGDGSAMPREDNCTWREDKCPSPGLNTFLVYKNGEQISKATSISKDHAYSKCKYFLESYPTAVIKCTWNGEVVYATSVATNNESEKGEYLGYLNGQLFIQSSSATKLYALGNCKTIQSNNPLKSMKCTWKGVEIYSKSAEDSGTQIKADLGTLIAYKNGEQIAKYESMSKDSAYSKCKYLQATYPSNVIKCTWNEEIIYAESNQIVICNSEQTLVNGVCKDNTFQYTCSTGKVVQVPHGVPTSSIESKYCGLSVQNVPTVPQVLGAQTMCVSLTRNFHRGDESEDTRLLQTFLNANEFMDSEVTGFYGDKTIEAVKRYQKSKGLPETGMVFDFTRTAIVNDSCR